MSYALSVLSPPVEVFVSGRRSEEMIRRGALLRALRQEVGRSPAEVAQFVDLSVEGYRMYEKGYVRIRQEFLPKLALALDMQVGAVARRLEMPMLHEVEKGTSLFVQVAAILGPEKADMVEQIVSELADLPDSDQRLILEGIRDQIRGRKARSPHLN